MNRSQLIRALAMCALLISAPLLLLGQAVNFAQIHGRVIDSSGALVVGAQITVTQAETGLVRTATTNTEGRYVLPNLPLGPYQLHASAQGFRDYRQQGIVLQVGGSPEINITLAVGMVSEAVEVKETQGDTASVLELKVAKEDLGRIIGKQGRTAKSIRTILNAAASRTNRKVVLEIIEEQ